MAADTTTTSLGELKQVIRTCPVIDNHAHNILRPHQLKSANFLTITTEAAGEALDDAPKSLAHLRAVRQLKKLYDLPADADWAAIVGKRAELLERDADILMKKCFEGTQTILVDDGLDSGANIERYSWHDKYTTSACKRIVRIETVAASILSTLYQQGKLPVGVAVADEEACNLGWVSFIAEFEQAIVGAIQDDEVVGFKSVICYRTGLDVTVGRDHEVNEHGLRSFSRHYLPEALARDFRVEAKGMNDALVISACKLIAAAYEQGGMPKPLQFHTGLGDNDISLLDSSPACLQPLIKHFPTVPIVLLHSSYPYTREAGYLATVYRNVYLDIGEVFPMVSREGQEKIVRQTLELTPTSKILWSTDGHHFPETYWLANVQGREAIEKVLCDYVEHEDLTVAQATQAAQDIFYNNSNALYNLRLDALGLLLREKPTEQDQEIDDPNTERPMPHVNGEGTTLAGHDIPRSPYDSQQLTRFTTENPDIQFVVVQWLDYLGTLRSRWLPIHAFDKLVQAGNRIGISKGNLGTLQNDKTTPVCDPVGQILVEPDLDSLRIMQTKGMIGPAASSCMARFTDDAMEPLSLCPRSQVQGFVKTLERDHHVNLLVGFEIEVTFCRRGALGPNGYFAPLDSNHAWGTLSDEQVAHAFPLMAAISLELKGMGIEIEQLHSESGAGQYEFVLPPLPPVRAVDTLIQARQCIQQIAAAQGLRATYHPQPFPGIGTAAHAHVSLNSDSLSAEELEKAEKSFWASVLAHLPALCAFTMPQAGSYGRVVDDGWTSGTWVAWGTQNREVPLRRVETWGVGKGSRWEVRCLDGLANMYLALGAILGAGLQGVREGTEMVLMDCISNPSILSDEQKRELGITQRLPTSLDQALEALQHDGDLADALATGVASHYLAMKQAEQKMLNLMPHHERKRWLMERY